MRRGQFREADVEVGPQRARRRTSWFLTLALATAMVPLGAAPALAYQITVCDSGCDATTIQEGVDLAAPDDTVLVSPGTYEETVYIESPLTIEGVSEGVVLNGAGEGGPMVEIDGVDVVLANFTITGASAGGDGGAISAQGGSLDLENMTITDSFAMQGGGVYYKATAPDVLTITDSTISGNSANEGAGLYITGQPDVGYAEAVILRSRISANDATDDGGGILIDTADLFVERSTLDFNTANLGGGIYSYDGSVEVSASTVYSNSADSAGGGALAYLTSMTVARSTITDNSAPNGSAFFAATETSHVLIGASILHGNSGGFACSAPADVDPAGVFTSLGWNFMEDVNACAFDPTANDIDDGGDPLLDELSDDFTPVLYPLPGSPVIDAADPEVPGVDQLGTVRPQGLANDNGAVEVIDEAPNTPPVAIDDVIDGAADTVVLISPLDNDIDDDNDPLRISNFGPEIGGGEILVCDTDGYFGDCLYDPESEGGSFPYFVSDGEAFDEGLVTVNAPSEFAGSGTAVIDGVPGEGEWDDAASFDMALAAGSSRGPGVVRLMNDDANLYVLIEASGFPNQNPEILISFDDPSTDALYYTNDGFVDMSHIDGLIADPSQDGQGASYLSEGYLTIEFSHPLDSGDGRDIDLSPGETVGFQIEAIFSTPEDGVAISLAPGGDFFDYLDWTMTGDATGEITGVSIDTSSTEIPTGFGVQLADIPAERLLAGAERVAGSSLDAVGIVGSPLGSIPLGSIPLGSITTGQVGTVVLSDLRIEGGWARLLDGTTLAGKPLQTITLAEALEVIPADVLATVALEDLDLGSTSVGDLSLAALTLGDATLADLGLECPAGAVGCDAATSTVLDVESAGGSITAVPLGSIPLGSIPLGSIPLGSIPLGSIPLGSIPLGAIGDIVGAPLGAIPLGSIGDLAAAPLGSIPLGSIPLGSIPLGSIPLGSIPLGSIPLGSIPLGAIDVGGDFCAFHDAASDQSCAELGIDPLTTTVSNYLALLRADGLAATPLGSIPLGSIPLGSIPLGSIDVAGVPLGAIDLASVDLAASPLGSIPLGSIPLGAITIGEVCAESSVTGCDAQTALADWAEGLPVGTGIDSTPLGAIPLGSIPLGSIPLGSIDLATVSIAGTPLGSIPLGSIDLAASPLGSIPLGSIANVTTLVDCGPANCATGTLGEAYAIGAILPTATLGALVAAVQIGDATLADVLEHLNLGFLAAVPALDGLTLGELIVPTLLAADLPWEEFPLEEIEIRDAACQFAGTGCTSGIPDLEAVVGFSVVDGPVDASVSSTIPDGFLYLAGSSRLLTRVGGDDEFPIYSTVSITDPVEEGGTLTFPLGDLAPGQYQVVFSMLPGYDLETVTISASAGGVDVESDQVAVIQQFEPGEVPTTEDTLYVTHIAEPGDTDTWVIPAPGSGTRVSVFLSNLDGDVDTFMYRPDTAPVSGDGTERAIPLGAVPVEDEGVDATGTGTLRPEVLADTPIDANQTLADSSTNRGTDPETVSVLQRDDVAEYRIDVSGYNGASSTRPYVLRVAFDEEAPVDQCTPRSYPGLAAGSAPTIPAGTQTIFLTNAGRMQAIHGDVSAVTNALAAVAGFTSGGVEVGGVVVDVADIPGVAGAFGSWDQNPCDPSAANGVVGLIAGYIQDVAAATPSLRNVTVVGSDEMVPFHRAADTTVVANESTYTDGFEDNALFGAHSTGHYLSDSPYGDLDPVPWLDRFAYLPDLAVGRLVETPAQIVGALDAFIDNGGILDPASAATAGYDFLSDGSEEIDAALAGFLGDANTDALINEAWTRQDLAGQFGSGADVLSPNAHYDHYRALPAIGNLTGSEADLFTIDDVEGLDLANRIIFTMGCHGGLNVDGTAGLVAQPEDWAEVYGGLRAVYIGNTGYGYGDSATVALSERVMANLAVRLDGSYTIGQALADAKQDQFGRAGLYGVYDLKAIEEATLYGLPFWQIAGPGVSEVPASETGPLAVEPLTGLEAAGFSIDPGFETVTTTDGTYVSSDEGTQFLHWRPIQPLAGLEVGTNGKVATGTVLTKLNSRDTPAGNAVFARPSTTDAAGREPEIETSGVIFPTTFANVATFGQVNATPVGPPIIQRQRVNLIAGQYIDIGGAPIQRLFDTMEGIVYYVDEGAVGATDFTPPSIDLVEGDAAGSQAVFRVQASDPQSGVERVVVLYLSSVDAGVGSWTPVDLLFDPDSQTWIGGGPIGSGVTAPVPYIVQAVNGDGVVGVSSSKQGAHQAAAGDPVFAPDAVDDEAITDAGVAVDIDVLANDTDPDGDLDPASLTVTTDPANGTTEVVAGVVRYTPEPGFAGTDSFTYRVCDLTGLCDLATVTVTVVGVNSPPDAVDDEASTPEGVAVDIAVLSNDTDPDDDLDPTSLSVSAQPAVGTAEVLGAGIRYTPEPGFVGTDTLTYQVCDLTDLCDEATVTVIVTAAPVPPEVLDDEASTVVDVSVVVDVLANDTDANGDLDPSSLSVTEPPANGSAAVVGGAIEYTPDAGFAGYDTFAYQVCDLTGACGSAVVDVTVALAPEGPDAANDLMYVVDGNPTAIFVLDNDIDANGDLDPASLDLVTQPSAGSTAVVAGAEGPVVVFTPDANQQGSASFDYQVCDLSGGCDVATVSVLVGIEWCTIAGTAGNDVLNGTPGRDVICGLGADDTIRGLSGDDVLIGGDGKDNIIGGGGADLIFGGEGDDYIDGQDGVDTIHGGNGNDRIIGGTHSDLIFGNAGDDVVNGGVGNDLIFLGTGNDQGYGDQGLDTIRGDQGGSKVIGGGQSGDLLIGGAESDIIAGGEDADRIFAGGGADVIFGGNANDFIDAGPGDDLVYGGNGQDTLIGGEGDDTLLAENGDDLLFGGAGMDVLTGGAGFDIAYGGGGADTCSAEQAFGC